MGEVFDLQLINTAMRQSTPLILAALGGLMSERVGVVNIGLEGKILMGAFAGALGALFTGSPWIGLVCAILVGLTFALIHAVATQELRTDHIARLSCPWKNRASLLSCRVLRRFGWAG